MKEKFQTLLQKPFAIPAVFAILIILAYGILVPRMGYYWDDLPFAWFLKFFGPAEFIPAFKPFRPLLGYVFLVTTAIFGGNPILWQILGLLARFILGLQVWFLLRRVFPTRERSALWVALLFTVYPAFGQQWVALTHVNQEFIPLIFLLSSFIITVNLLRNDSNSKTPIAFAILLQIFGLFSTEYFFGLEILRLFFILAILSESLPDRKDLLKKSLTTWLPYLIVWLVNAVWTYSYHRSQAYNSYQISLPSLLSPLALINEFINTLSLSGFVSWLNTFNIFAAIDTSTTQIIAFCVFLLAFVITLGVTSNKEQETSNKYPVTRTASHVPHHWFLTIGLIAIFAGRLPSWAAGLPLKIEFDYDRFFISIMLGASLFIVGLADLLLKEGRAKPVVLSLIIGMSAASQFTSANTYRRDWANTQDLFWQMAWRMPALEESTTVLTYELPLQYLSDYQLMSALNWMYAPNLEGRELPYALQYLKTRFEAFEIKPDQPIEITYRTTTFSGNTSNVVVIYKEADGCLRVLDPVYNNAETVPGASFYLLEAIPLSNPDLILADAPAPVMEKTLFGNEPSHGWCYTYAKAEIARQNGDWEKVAKLYKDAQKNELSPALPVEYLPFIEAFALTGDMDTAFKLTERTIKGRPTLCPALNTILNRVSGEVDVSQAKSLLQKECQP
ncbi:MAG: hypothetical protein JETCAE01_09410 [Anaerolineaceae bacterium]|nr:MAG: hypothetical protein JETCAE01_09410 [Anaerolineaceae bacterium]